MHSFQSSIVLGLFALGTTAWGGGIDSGGGDNPPFTANSAWFLGGQTVHYCFVTSGSFPLKDGDLESTFSKATQIWKSYFSEHDPQYPATHKISLNYAVMPKCDGTEDLKLFFGMTDGRVEKAMTQYTNPTAFAERTSFDVNRGWGKGFIWIQDQGKQNAFPDWSRKNSLLAILLHELGHVMGCPHIEGTIMTADISQVIWRSGAVPSNIDPNSLSQIDGSTALSPSGYRELKGGIDLRTQNNSSAAIFQLMTGRNPVGKVTTLLVGHLDWYQLKLLYRDDLGMFEFPITINSNIEDGYDQDTVSIGEAFKTVAVIPGVGEAGYNSRVEATVTYGSVRSTDGRTLSIQIQENMQGMSSFAEAGSAGPVRIHYLDQGFRKPLYTSLAY